jgi:myosin heavy subunit
MGTVSETLRLILTKFTDETITIFGMLLLLTTLLIVIYWLYNRKKFRELTHEIPASVVKNYLDSIIQNSNALKSSLFRGGGLDIGTGIPSVVPVGDLPSSSSIGVGSGLEEVNQKNAEIAMLKQNLNDRTKLISDLEKQLADASHGKGGGDEATKKELANVQAKLKEAENALAEARKSSGGDPQLQGQVNILTNERNELRLRLQEYEIIEEDLANLKRLQQENEQLKAELAALKKSGSAAPVSAPAAPIAAQAAPVEEEIDLEAEMAKAIADSKAPAAAPAPQVEDVPVIEGEQKSAEELLSEFEKMLG